MELFAQSSLGLCRLDLQGNFTWVNQQMCAITGYSMAKLLDLRVPDVTHPDDRDADGEMFQRVIQGDQPAYHIDKRYVR